MLKSIFRSLYVFISKCLRNTWLKRVSWVSRIHNWLYISLMGNKQLHAAGFIFNTDLRDRTISKKIAIYGDYEGYMREVLLSYARAASTVVDVGANIGLHTIPLSKQVGENGNIIAFEPDPDNYSILLSNIKLNSSDNVQAFNMGLSSKQESRLLYQSDINRGGLSLCKDNVESEYGNISPVSIDLIDGDSILQKYSPNISLIKIDVEGAEPLVIEGLKNVIDSNPELAIVFEFSPSYILNFGIDPQTFLSTLEKRGFILSVIDEQNQSSFHSYSDQIIELGESSEKVLNIIASKSHKPT